MLFEQSVVFSGQWHGAEQGTFSLHVGVFQLSRKMSLPVRPGCQSRKSEEGEKSPITLINPEIVWFSEEDSKFEEGCLSIPHIREEIKRPSSVQVKFTDINGILKESCLKGLWATCIQHEIDHLNGKLFIDYLGPIKRSFITKKMKKYKKEIIK